MRERRPIYPLRAQYIYIVEFGKLLGSECLQRSENHVARIMDNNVQVSMVFDDRPNRRIHRCLRRNIHFKRVQVYAIVVCKCFCRICLCCITAANVTHTGINDMPGSSQCSRCESTKTTGCPGNHNYVLHRSPFPSEKYPWQFLK